MNPLEMPPEQFQKMFTDITTKLFIKAPLEFQQFLDLCRPFMLTGLQVHYGSQFPK